jgi:hypothetical protein
LDETYWVSCLSEKLTSSSYGEGLETEPRSLPRQSLTRQNQGFNEAKSRHGLEHICHHHANSLLIGWLLTMLALTIERLYRLRYLRRGAHSLRSSAELFLTLWINLFRPCPTNSS